MAKKPRKKKLRIDDQKRNYSVSILLYLALYLFCVVIGVANTALQPTSFEVGTLCEETVTAPRNIVDEHATELLRQEAMQKVAPIYVTDSTAAESTQTEITRAFQAVENVRVQARTFYLDGSSVASQTNFRAANVDWAAVLSQSEKEQLLSLLPDYFAEQDIDTIASMEADKIVSLRDALIEKINKRMEEGLLADDVEGAAENIRSEFVSVGTFTNAQAELAARIAVHAVKPNMTFDAEATERAREAAAAAVEPKEYKKGQNIVQKGEIITESQHALIQQLGLSAGMEAQLPRWIVGSVLMLLVFGCAILYLFQSDLTLLESGKEALSLTLLTALGMVLALICKRIDLRLNLVFLPAILGSVILKKRRTKLLYGGFLSLIVAFIMAPDSGFFFDEQVVRTLVSSMIGCTVAVLMMRKKQRRGEYVLAGLLAGVANALVYFCYGVMQSFRFNEFVVIMGFGVANGLISGLLSVGLLPVWEAMFSLATPSKLLELSNPSNPLLKRLMIEAPGTYHHSVMTANLAEAGAEVVGADAMLARVSAYYHDIGKLTNPLMFKENQMGIKNPHDDLTPDQSAAIIIRHVGDGVALAEKNKLPQKMIEIISQHHGNSLTGYFYIMAKKQEEDVKQADYRYPWSKPTTKEAGVVMLADVVEAAIRANSALRSGNLKEQIDKLIKAKYDDGQLDECPLNRRDLRRISEAFIYVLEGANHERIVYPEEEEES